MHGRTTSDMNEIRSADIYNKKKDTRKMIRDSIARMSPRQRREASEAAARILMDTRIWKEAGCVLAYLAFGTEMNADRLVGAALREGKALFVPRVDGKEMSFHRILSADGPFERGVFGIRQPAAEDEPWELGASGGLTLVVVPGMAFDVSGGRLGRGGAYYDRFISECRASLVTDEEPRMRFIAYGYSSQIIDRVPRNESDQRVDGIVSQDGLIMTHTTA